MILSSSYRSRAACWILLWLFAKTISGANLTCGALVTYNQYTDISKTAPTCFQKGCGSGNMTSMSSTCQSASACYPIWSILHQEYQQDWCSTCHEEDRACRIAGWPLLNATAACNMSPNTWLFNNKGCCTNGGDEMASLASWISTLCNGTWRDQFKYYDGMALRDWQEWLSPDNRTVAPPYITQEHCTANKARYLGILGMENVVVFILIIAYFFLTLWISREDAHNQRWIRYTKKVFKPLKWIKTGLVSGFKFVFCIRGPGGSTWPVIKTILLAIFFAGVQLFFNFASAYVVKDAPGYEHVNAPMLALLFCTRPRLGWLACFLSIIPSTWIEKFFKVQQSKVLAKGMMSVARVGISAAIGEIIMQLLSTYYLGITVRIGTIRGFYKHNHLSPFWKGLQARDMYNGALLWAIALPAVTSVWIAVIFLLGAVMLFYGSIISGWNKIRDMARKQKKKLKKGGKTPETAFFIPETPVIQVSAPPEHHFSRQTMLYDPAPPPVSEPSSVSAMDDDGGRVSLEQAEAVQIPQMIAPRMATVPRYRDSVSSSPLEQHPVQVNEPVTNEDSFADPIPPQPRVAQNNTPRPLTGYQPINTATDIPQDEIEEFPAQLRPGNTNSISTPHYTDEFDTTSPTNAQPPRFENTSINRIHNLPHDFSNPLENPRESDNPFSDPSSHNFNNPLVNTSQPNFRHRFPTTRPARFTGNTAYQGIGSQDIEETPAQTENEKPKPPAWAHTPRNIEEWKVFIIGLGIFWGFISYIAQWLFWSGFVNSADDRFCPPSTGALGILWVIAGAMGFGAVFGMSYGGASPS